MQGWIEGLQRSIAFIEQHLTDELDIEEIAGKAALSPFYSKCQQSGNRINTKRVPTPPATEKLVSQAKDPSRPVQIIFCITSPNRILWDESVSAF